MTEFTARRHRLSLPSASNSDDPATLKKEMATMRQLVMDEFNRMADDFYQFKKVTFEAGVIPLKQINDLVVTYDEYSMTAVWENPQQEDIEATHVRVRISEITPNDWAEYTYPKNTWEFNGLEAGTQYTLQVQLIGRYEASDTFVSTTRNCPSVPVLRIAESAIKAKVFTTLSGVAPPTDPGLTDPEITFPFPDPPDTGGAVDSALCWWEYGFQNEVLTDLPGGRIPIWTDIGSLTEFSGLVSSVTIDTSAAPFDAAGEGPFRMKYRSVCDSVPGGWVYTPSFMKADLDGSHLCGDFTASASLAESPYSTADLFAIPKPCHPIGSWFRIEDGVTDTEIVTHGPAYAGTALTGGEWTVFGADTSSLATGYGQIMTGQIAGLATLHDESDFMFSIDLWMEDPYYAGNQGLPGGQTRSYDVMILGNKIKLAAVFYAATWSAQVTVPRAGGGSYVFRADSLPYGAWTEIFYQHDVSEATGRVLYIDGVSADASTTAWLNDFDGIDDTYKIYSFPFMRMRKNYGWGTVVTPPVPPIPLGPTGAAVTPAPRQNDFSIAIISDYGGLPMAIGQSFTVRLNFADTSPQLGVEKQAAATDWLLWLSSTLMPETGADFWRIHDNATVSGFTRARTVTATYDTFTWGRPGDAWCVEIEMTVNGIGYLVSPTPVWLDDGDYDGEGMASSVTGNSHSSYNGVGSIRFTSDPNERPRYYFNGTEPDWT